MSRSFRPSLHDKFTYIDDIQNVDSVVDKAPVADYKSGSPAGAVPRYAEVAREESLYDLSEPLFPWRPSPELPTREARSLVEKYRLKIFEKLTSNEWSPSVYY
jgi:hypothetical protein